ncbi:MAG TPA: flagellar assembly protein FliH [Burkholderiaceae bacterium]|nr:flagellar assembly protein FliH [Burkholderiaceae bacterium]
MKAWRPYRFPPLAHLAPANTRTGGDGSQWQASLAQGFEQGRSEGYESGLASGRHDGFERGHREGLQQGYDAAHREVMVRFEALAGPLDAMMESLQQIQASYQAAQRKEVVELVARVARQVIRAELALQPVQLMALVDETLASMPPTRDTIEVFLNPEELQRIRELDPQRAAQWTLIGDPRLEPGECRVKAGDHEADAGCKQRLAAYMEQVSAQLQESADVDLTLTEMSA